MNDYRLANLHRDDLMRDARRSRIATEVRWTRWARRRLAAWHTPAWPTARPDLRIVR